MDAYSYQTMLQRFRKRIGSIVSPTAFKLLHAAHPARSGERPPMIIYTHANGQLYRWQFATWRDMASCSGLGHGWFNALKGSEDMALSFVHPDDTPSHG